MKSNENSLNWFEIPASDIKRATKFYESVFGIKMEQQNVMGKDMAYFPYEAGNGRASGGLVKSPAHKPSTDGAKIYLNGNPDLSKPLANVEKAGGKVTMAKTKISDDIGFMAFFVDSEGNTVALHSQN